MIRRPPRSTRVRSSAASDVYKRQCSHQPFLGLSDRFNECPDPARILHTRFGLHTTADINTKGTNRPYGLADVVGVKTSRQRHLAPTGDTEGTGPVDRTANTATGSLIDEPPIGRTPHVRVEFGVHPLRLPEHRQDPLSIQIMEVTVVGLNDLGLENPKGLCDLGD